MGLDKSASVYESFPFIWPYNALIGQVAAPKSGEGFLTGSKLENY